MIRHAAEFGSWCQDVAEWLGVEEVRQIGSKRLRSRTNRWWEEQQNVSGPIPKDNDQVWFCKTDLALIMFDPVIQTTTVRDKRERVSQDQLPFVPGRYLVDIATLKLAATS